MQKFKKGSIFEQQFNFNVLLEQNTPLDAQSELYKMTVSDLNDLSNLQINVDSFTINNDDNTAQLSGNVQNQFYYYYHFGSNENVVIKTLDGGLVITPTYLEVIQKLMAYYMTFAKNIKENFNFTK